MINLKKISRIFKILLNFLYKFEILKFWNFKIAHFPSTRKFQVAIASADYIYIITE